MQAVVSGWGTLSTGGSTPTVLHEVTINTMSNSQVRNTIMHTNLEHLPILLQCTGSSTDYSGSDITARMLCASAQGKDACQGDSGGDYGGGWQKVLVMTFVFRTSCDHGGRWILHCDRCGVVGVRVC